MSAAFPRRPEEFTTGYVEQLFGAPAGSLRALSHTPVGTGQVCDSYRMRCDWADGPDGDARPASFIAKCPSGDATSRGAAALFRLYDTEVGWYRDAARGAGVSCPHPYHAAIDPEDDQRFVLLLQDMAPAQQGDQLAGGTIAQVRATLREAAALHAWRPESGDIAALRWPLNSENNGAYVREWMPANYPRFRERFAHLLDDAILDQGQALIDRFDAYLDHVPDELCLSHGDMRLDNVLYSADGGRAWLVDWQTCALGTAAADVAYMIGTSFADPADRRNAETDLIADYLARRAELGAPADFDAFWQAYRRAAFSGFLMAVNASLHVEQTERGDTMFAAMAERPAQMALDLDSLAVI